MGKGDRRSKRGKIWRGTHGKRRLRKKKRIKKLAQDASSDKSKGVSP